jgi:chaperonin cofactor prefoldin
MSEEDQKIYVSLKSYSKTIESHEYLRKKVKALEERIDDLQKLCSTYQLQINEIKYNINKLVHNDGVR